MQLIMVLLSLVKKLIAFVISINALLQYSHPIVKGKWRVE